MYVNWLILGVLLCDGTSPEYRGHLYKSRHGANHLHRNVRRPLHAAPLTEMVRFQAPNKSETLKSLNERYPHAVMVGLNCGGTIIHPSWVLTAGHCTLQMGVRFILAGTDRTNNGTGILRTVKRLIIHPLFSIGPYWLNPHYFNIKQVAAWYDFLLVELNQPLPFDGKTIAAAKLYKQSCVPVGLNVSFAGFGSSNFKGIMRNEMHELELVVQSNKVCDNLEQYNKQDMLCAKGRPPRFDSACNGDSGSGLVDEHGQLIGVLSWAENDALECTRGALVVFSRVSKVQEWIRIVTRLH